MIRKKLDTITEEDIEDLIVSEELESKTIEYKSELPSNTYESKKKFLASVVSFINTIGGDLIFGIQEDRSTGKPSSHEGISLSNAEQEVLRLEQMIRNGIEPIQPSSVYRTKIPSDYRKWNYKISELLVNKEYTESLKTGKHNRNMMWAGLNLNNLEESIMDVYKRGELSKLQNFKQEVIDLVKPYLDKTEDVKQRIGLDKFL